ncbi:crossover junction endodeoxyribonuclease RuvC [Rhodococcus qingshengii]
MTTVVGLDPSLTAAGVAILSHPKAAETPNVPKLATVGMSGSESATLAERSIRIVDQRDRIIRSMPPSVRLVVIEALPFSAPKFAGLYQERCALYYALVEFLARRKIPVVEVGATTLKKYATGDGRADKREVVNAMRDLWPHAKVRNDNEADALALATMGAMRLGWHEPEMVHHFSPNVNWTGVSR